jgi:hypothetical protein
MISVNTLLIGLYVSEIIQVNTFFSKVIDLSLIQPFKLLVQNISFGFPENLFLLMINFFQQYFEQNRDSKLIYEDAIVSILTKLSFTDKLSFIAVDRIGSSFDYRKKTNLPESYST